MRLTHNVPLKENDKLLVRDSIRSDQVFCLGIARQHNILQAILKGSDCLVGEIVFETLGSLFGD